MTERSPLGALMPRAIAEGHPDAYPLVDAPRGFDSSALNDAPVCARDRRATTEGGLMR